MTNHFRKNYESMYKPRKPTEDELNALYEFALELVAYMPDEEEIKMVEDNVARAAICVFDNYKPDRLGTPQRVMSVIWPFNGNYYQVFIFKGQELVPLKQHEQCIMGDEYA